MGFHYQLFGVIGKQFLEVLNLSAHRRFEVSNLVFKLFLLHLHLVLVHFLYFSEVRVVGFLLGGGAFGAVLLLGLWRVVVVISVGACLFVDDLLQKVNSCHKLCVQKFELLILFGHGLLLVFETKKI